MFLKKIPERIISFSAFTTIHSLSILASVIQSHSPIIISLTLSRLHCTKISIKITGSISKWIKNKTFLCEISIYQYFTFNYTFFLSSTTFLHSHIPTTEKEKWTDKTTSYFVVGTGPAPLILHRACCISRFLRPKPPLS